MEKNEKKLDIEKVNMNFKNLRVITSLRLRHSLLSCLA